MRVPLPVLLLALLILLLPALAILAHGVAESVSLLLTLGRASGVLGMTALLLASLLSLRRPPFDTLLGGLTAVWHLHHMLGAVGFLALLMHPLLLALAAAERAPATINALLWPPFSTWHIWLGWLSLLLLFVALTPSFQFWGRPPYQRWKGLHALAAVAVLVALAHAVSLEQVVPFSRTTWLWLPFGLLALCSFGYRFWLAPRFAVHHYRLQAIEALAPDVAELILVPEQQSIQHHAGQFVYVRHFDPVTNAGYNEEHPYTLSSAPAAPALRIGIKALGDASRAMLQLPVGTPLTLEGPYGKFFVPEVTPGAELWLAGGIGITPFVARLRELTLHPDSVGDIQLFYCVDRPDRASYLPVLNVLLASLPSVKLHLHYFRQSGALDAAFLAERCPDFGSRRVYLCGPPAMNRHVRPLLKRAGVPTRRIRSEEFNLL